MTTLNKTLAVSAALFTLSLAAAVPAAAQQAGTYDGKMKNGDLVQFIVARTSKGDLAVTGGMFEFSAAIKCESTTTTVAPNVGFTLVTPVVITDAKATVVFNNGADDYVAAKLAFSGTRASGDVTAAFAAFAAYTGHPTKAVYCAQSKEEFTAALANAMTGPAAPAPKLLFY
jgi:hypothetical protein